MDQANVTAPVPITDDRCMATIQEIQTETTDVIRHLKLIQENQLVKRYNAQNLTARIKETTELQQNVLTKTEECNLLNHSLESLKYQNSIHRDQLKVKQDCEAEVAGQISKKHSVTMAQLHLTLNRLGLKYHLAQLDNGYDWQLELCFGAGNTVVLQHNDDTGQFTLLKIEPKPTNLQGIKDFLCNTNDVAGLLCMCRKFFTECSTQLEPTF